MPIGLDFAPIHIVPLHRAVSSRRGISDSPVARLVLSVLDATTPTMLNVYVGPSAVATWHTDQNFGDDPAVPLHTARSSILETSIQCTS